MKVWKPKHGESYYYIADDGCIYEETWTGDKEDIYRWETGNCKQTEAECEFKREKAKVETALENFAKEHNEPIEDGKNYRFFIVWAYEEQEIGIRLVIFYKGSNIYFSSKEIAEAAVKEVGEEKVKKYYLGVE